MARRRILDSQHVQSEALLRCAIDAEQLRSASLSWRALKISDKEAKYHNGRTVIDIATTVCNPEEQLTMTFEKELNSHEVQLPVLFGCSTLIVALGGHSELGWMYSMLLCTRKTKNNSPNRRRWIAYAANPTTDGAENLRRILAPILPRLTVLF